MRTALVSLCLFFGFTASSQQIDMERLKKNHPSLQQFPGTQMPNAHRRLSPPSATIAGVQPPHLFFNGKSPGVYSLPLDNMPCVVPDTRDIAVIPNPGLGYKQPTVGRIPNKKISRSEIIVAPPTVR